MLKLRHASALSLLLAGCAVEPEESIDDGSGSLDFRAAELTPADALESLAASLSMSFDAEMEELDPKDRARIVNAMAWDDEHPRELRVSRSRRKTVRHVSARYLAHDDAPKGPKQEPSLERAELLFASGGIGRALMALGPDESVVHLHDAVLASGHVKFVFEHRFADYEVYEGQVVVTLDDQGRMTRFDAGPAATIAPVNTLSLDESDAVELAITDLKDLEDPLWEGGEIKLHRTTKMVANLESLTGADEDRYIWRIELLGTDDQPGDREVLVDGETGQVLASIERTQYMLDSRDTITPSSGVIELNPMVVTTGAAWTGNLWDHPTQGCADIGDPPFGDDALMRDWDESKAALCEATRWIEAASGVPWREWFDPGNDGVHLKIGLTPLLSVGINTGRWIGLARGVARAEVIGHELFHTVLGGSRRTMLGGGPEQQGVVEHMCDTFGLLLERRFPNRTEDACFLNNDPDSMDAHAQIDLEPGATGYAYRWCSDEGEARPWRSACEPEQVNSGWCEGASRYSDLGYNVYDIYGQTSGSNAHVPSHTNLGIGNRVLMALLGESRAGFNPARMLAADDATVLDLLLQTAESLSGAVDWSNYADTLLASARELDPGVAPGPLERNLRTSFSRARLWTRPSVVTAGSPTSPELLEPTPEGRVAAASTFVRVDGSPGMERTYLFYRPNRFSNEVRYVWRDDSAGDEYAVPTGGWQGSCELPGVSTYNSVSTVGRLDAGIWVAYNDAASADEIGTLRVTGLTPGGEASYADPCGDDWAEVVPTQARSMLGAPSIADWTAASNRTICDLLGAEFGGITLPFHSIGAMNPDVGDCVDIGEQMPPWVGTYVPDGFPPFITKFLFPRLAKGPLDSLPVLFDPENPVINPGPVEQTIPLVTLLRDDEDLQDNLSDFGVVGPRFAEAFGDLGQPEATLADMRLEWNLDGGGDPKTGLPSGQLEAILFRFSEAKLVVAFRDPSGAVRVAPFMDPRSTSDIPMLESDPVADPVLATASREVREGDGAFVELDYLYVIYGTTADDGAGPVGNRVTYRVAGFIDEPSDPSAFKAEIFAPATRLDNILDVRGEKRQVDYRTLRTLQTPAVAGRRNMLDMFVVGLRASSHEPSDGPVAELNTSSNRIRHVNLNVELDGKLTWNSERPVLLNETRVAHTGTAGAGAAFQTHGRRKLRWFYANGTELQVRSRR